MLHILRGGQRHYEWFSGGYSIKLKYKLQKRKITIKIHTSKWNTRGKLATLKKLH